jgi:hypothetical protein
MPPGTRGRSNAKATQRRVASHTIERDIFDRPYARSRNVIGTSTMRIPARLTVYTPSTWKPYPSHSVP